jgi:hypothetical protein
MMLFMSGETAAGLLLSMRLAGKRMRQLMWALKKAKFQ